MWINPIIFVCKDNHYNAKAEADANKILEKQMTNKILAQQWIKKWNGEVPKVSGDNKSMINIGDLIK